MKRNDRIKILCGFVCTVILSLHGSANGQEYDVTLLGSFAPGEFPGSPSLHQPYMVIKAAIENAPNTEISIQPGYYGQPGIYDRPATLVAPDGVVEIGVNVGISTVFSLVALNTHMAGDTIFPSWADAGRTTDIANICAQEQWDFVGFSEMWDEDYFCDGCCGLCGSQDGLPVPLLPQSGYPHGRVGDDGNCTPGCDPQHSGLAVMSNYPISFFQQYNFADCPENPCDDLDCFANKGFVWSRFQKDTFFINVITTHMQADTDQDKNVQTRREQMNCISAQIDFHMILHQQDVYFIVGDTNVPGETEEYGTEMWGAFGSRFNDGARNVPGFVPADQVTNSNSNPLALCFDCDTGNFRFDQILFTPQSFDTTVKVFPLVTSRFKFLGVDRTDDCDDCPDGGDLTTNEKSDHWAVEGEFRISRTE